MADKVILRRWRGLDSGNASIIALFPDDVTGPGLVNSYEHVGQHGDAVYAHVVSQTTLVRYGDPEGMALLDELRAIGYDPIQFLRRHRR